MIFFYTIVPSTALSAVATVPWFMGIVKQPAFSEVGAYAEDNKYVNSGKDKLLYTTVLPEWKFHMFYL